MYGQLIAIPNNNDSNDDDDDDHNDDNNDKMIMIMIIIMMIITCFKYILTIIKKANRIGISITITIRF